MIQKNNSYCGRVAIVGRPNVGKSTLLNALVGQKISIVSSKPQTTRHGILGVLNRDEGQAVFVDTPGIQRDRKRLLHRFMGRAIRDALDSSDLALMVVARNRFTQEDRRLAEMLGHRLARTLLVVNKIDTFRDKAKLLPFLESLSKEFPFRALIPLSALTGENLGDLVNEIFKGLPQGEAIYPQGVYTDRDIQFRAAEIVREKLTEILHQEIPYGLTVEVEHMKENEKGQVVVHALIWLERDSQKAIVIGKQGQVLKEVGKSSRRELKALMKKRIHLELWVKVRRRWADSERELKRFGFDSL